MDIVSKWMLTVEEKNEYISEFLPKLSLLRAKAGISQEELSMVIGVSRQTYGSIERGLRELSWNTFLSLILFFDYNNKTHDMLHSSYKYADEIRGKMNAGEVMEEISLKGLLDDDQLAILSTLDEQAIRSIRTMIMVEYARCTATPGDVVVKAFDGMNFNIKPKDEQAEMALKMIKKQRTKGQK